MQLAALQAQTAWLAVSHCQLDLLLALLPLVTLQWQRARRLLALLVLRLCQVVTHCLVDPVARHRWLAAQLRPAHLALSL